MKIKLYDVRWAPNFLRLGYAYNTVLRRTLGLSTKLLNSTVSSDQRLWISKLAHVHWPITNFHVKCKETKVTG